MGLSDMAGIPSESARIKWTDKHYGQAGICAASRDKDLTRQYILLLCDNFSVVKAIR
jgi:hypothetical protein